MSTSSAQFTGSRVGLVLDQVNISGFRSLRHVDLRLGQLNVLIGQNGAGKSNLIGAFSMLGAMLRGELRSYVAKAGGYQALLYRGEQPATSLSFDLQFHESAPHLVNSYQATLEPSDDQGLFFSREVAAFHDTDQYAVPYGEYLGVGQRESTLASDHVEGVARWVRDVMKQWIPFHFHDTSRDSAMKSLGPIDDNRQLRVDGANLAAVLYLLRETQPVQYRQIRDTVRNVAPFFDDFHLRPDPFNTSNIQLEWQQRDTSGYFNAHALSDGTLRYIALATLLLKPDPPSLILIDEPELGLHPYAIHLLAGLLQSCSSQVIVSTQSVTVLDQMPIESVVIAENDHEGTSLSKPDPEALTNWLAEYSLSELWQKNLLGGQPGRW